MKYGTIVIENTLVPWLEDVQFLELYERIHARNLMPIARCYMLWSIARHQVEVRGLVAECGVYKGASALVIATAMAGKKPLHLFDSFSGIPPGEIGKDNRYLNGGEFADTSAASVMEFLKPSGYEFVIRPGLIPGTLMEFKYSEFSFVHLDLDIYRPTLVAMEFFYDRMVPGGVILLDDYGSKECAGAYLAVEEFSRSIRQAPIIMPSGQAMLVKAL